MVPIFGTKIHPLPAAPFSVVSVFNMILIQCRCVLETVPEKLAVQMVVVISAASVLAAKLVPLTAPVLVLQYLAQGERAAPMVAAVLVGPVSVQLTMTVQRFPAPVF